MRDKRPVTEDAYAAYKKYEAQRGADAIPIEFEQFIMADGAWNWSDLPIRLDTNWHDMGCLHTHLHCRFRKPNLAGRQ